MKSTLSVVAKRGTDLASVNVTRKRKTLSRAVGLITVLCASTICLEPAIGATPFPMGVYVGNPNGSNPTAEASFEADLDSFSDAMGATPKFIIGYVDFNQPISAWQSNASWQAWSNAKSPNAKSLIPIIGFPMASIASGSNSPDTQFQAFASGQYDAVIQNVILAWINQGFKKIILRPGWEMNITGPTYAGSDAQSQSDWVLAFRRIYKVAKRTAAGAGAKVSIVWNPNETNYTNANAIQSLYPGDRFVDVIGLDMYAMIYPFSDSSSPPTYHDWDTGQEDTSTAQFIADPINRAHYWSYPAATKWSNDSSGGHALSLDTVIQFALSHGKPIAIPETGAGEGTTDVADDPMFPQWLSQHLNAAIAAGGKVSFVAIWNSNAGGTYQFSYSSNSKPLECNAWKVYFGAQAKEARTK